MKDIYVNTSDCNIERDLEDSPNKAILMDCDGEILFIFPDYWTDEQIYTALRFANFTYRMGKSAGMKEKASEMRKALELHYKAIE